MRILTFILFTAICFVAAKSDAQLRSVTVTVTGSASTSQDAINRALVNAITQVNGAVVASAAKISLSQTTAFSGGKRASAGSKSYQSAISKVTKGVVQSFEILSKSPHPTLKNSVRVELRVTIAKFETSAQLNRKRIAVLPFRIGADVRRKSDGQSFQRSFSRELGDYLAQSRRFAVLDRNFLADQGKELNFLNSSGVKTAELARLGNRVGADLLVVGEIVTVSTSKQTRTMRSTGQKIVSRSSGGKVHFRVIDVATTQIKFSDTRSVRLGAASLSAAAGALARRAGLIIVNAIYPIRVVAVSGNTLTLGQGGKAVIKGGSYALIQYGKRLRDPYTKESLGREEIDVGRVRIETVQFKISTAKILKLKVKLSDIDSSNYIVRPVDNVSENRSKHVRKDAKSFEKEGRKNIDNLEKKSKNDW